MKIRTRNDIAAHIFPKHGVGAELGVLDGLFSAEILRLADPLTLHLVDHFEGVCCSGDKDGLNERTVNLDEAMRALAVRYVNDRRVRIYKAMSAYWVQGLPYSFLDFIYIDADHSYESVRIDLWSAWSKVKPGGIISGHDYATRFPGVAQAVDEFAKEHGLVVNLTTDDLLPSFWMIKL